MLQLHLVLLRLISDLCADFDRQLFTSFSGKTFWAAQDKEIPCSVYHTDIPTSDNKSEFIPINIANFHRQGLPINSQTSFKLPERLMRGNFASLFDAVVALRHPKLSRQSLMSPPMRIPFNEILLLTAEHVGEALRANRADKIISEASRRAVISYGGSKLPLLGLLGEHNINAAFFHIDNNLNLYYFCGQWHLWNTWRHNGQWAVPLKAPQTCVYFRSLYFFVGNWGVSNFKERFALTLLLSALKRFKDMVMAHPKYGDCYFRYGYARTDSRFTSSFFAGYDEDVKKRLIHVFMTPKRIFESSVSWFSDGTDLVGGNIIFRKFYRLNTFSHGHYPYRMSLALDNTAKYPLTRQPIALERSVKYFSAFDSATWACFSVALAGLIALAVCAVAVYVVHMPADWLPYNKEINVIIVMRLLFGFVEAPDCNWFRKSWSGGALVIFTWSLLVMAILLLYNNELRSTLIGQEFETPIEDLHDASPFDTQLLFTEMHQRNALFDIGLDLPDALLRYSLARRFVSGYFAFYPVNEDFTRYVHSVVMRHMQNDKNLVYVSRPHEFAYMASIADKSKGFFVRMGSRPLSKFMRSSDLIWLIPKHSVNAEKIDFAMKLIAQSGILSHVDGSELLADYRVNPHKWTAADEAQQIIRIGILSAMFQFLSVGLALSLMTFVPEKSINAYVKKSKRSLLPKCSNFKAKNSIAITFTLACFVFIIVIIMAVSLSSDTNDDVKAVAKFAFMTVESAPHIEGTDLLVAYSDLGECQTFVWNFLTPEFYRDIWSGDPFTPMISSTITVTNESIVALTLRSTVFVMRPGNSQSYYALVEKNFRASPTVVWLSERRLIWLTGGFTKLDRKHKDANASSSTRFFDMDILAFKQGPDLPLALVRHCAVALDQNRVFIYGGTVNELMKGQHAHENVSMNHMAFIFDFDSDRWTTLPELNSCGKLSSTPRIDCGLRNIQGDLEVIIPSSQIIDESPCTAIFNVAKFTWSKLEVDNREFPRAGRLITDDEDKILHLGGLDAQNNASDVVYELIGHSHWSLRGDLKLPIKVGGWQEIRNVSTDFCNGQKSFYSHGLEVTKKKLRFLPSDTDEKKYPEYLENIMDDAKLSMQKLQDLRDGHESNIFDCSDGVKIAPTLN